MRNLKKVLALALAMVMALSLMVTGAAARTSFEDDASITGAYREAVEVLTGLKVFKGKNTTDTFAPKDTITRAEVAAIIYRLVTADVTDKQAGIYADYAKFSDVASDHWAAGYIGYCSNAQYIVGDGAGRFNPDTKINGYQALTMILRAVGYDRNNEFKGSGWEVRVASSSKTLGILKNVTEGMLGQPASREMVAELLFQASLIPTVTYTTALGYNTYNSITASQVEVNKNPSLAWNSFKLHKSARIDIDTWGRPGYKWYSNCTRVAEGNDWKYTDNTNSPVATLAEAYKVRYTKAVRECDAWADAGFSEIGGSKDMTLYLNGNKVTEKYNLVSTDTYTKVGAQGRVTEIYADRVVMQDTFLAKVTGVTQRVLDAGGHVQYPSYLDLTVYDGKGVMKGGKDTTNAKVTLTNVTSDWTYAVGDMLLVNAYTCNTTVANDNRAAHGGDDRLGNGSNSPATEEDKNRAAYESEVVKDTRNIVNNNAPTPTEKQKAGKNVFIKGTATPFTGKQTTVTYLSGTHTMEGKVYNDALELHLNDAGNNTSTNYAWYFDDVEQADGSYSLIGIGNLASTTKYGVITDIYATQNVADTATNGTTGAVASVTYSDGTKGTEVISRILASTNAAPTDANNGAQAPANTQLKNDLSTVELKPMYNYQTTTLAADPLKTGARSGASNAQFAGWLYLSPAANVNKLQVANGTDLYGVLTSTGKDSSNLFKFVTTADGVKTAIEVAGKTDTAIHANENAGVYEWLYNSTYNAGTVLYKNLNHVVLNNNITVYVNNSTKFIVRIPETGAINVYEGVSKLPGDMKLVDDGESPEVDWVDENGDDVADVFYATARFDGTYGFNLLYFNGDADGSSATHETTDAAAWMENGKYYVRGWLNGEFKQVQIGATPSSVIAGGVTAEANFNAIKNSARTTNANDTYGGHIFAVRLSDGVVDLVLTTDTNKVSATGTNAYLTGVNPNVPYDGSTPNVALDGAYTTNGISFLVGSKNGNNYYSTGANATDTPANTKIAHYRVTTSSAFTLGVYTPGTANSTLTFRPDAPAVAAPNTVPTGAAGNATAVMDYHFTQDTVKYGDPNMLNWSSYDGQVRVSDVTIVYDEYVNGGTTVRTVRELYIDTELAGSTPGNVVPVAATKFVTYDTVKDNGTVGSYRVSVNTAAAAYDYDNITTANQSFLTVQQINVTLEAGETSIAVSTNEGAGNGKVSALFSNLGDLIKQKNVVYTNTTALNVHKGMDVYGIIWDGANAAPLAAGTNGTIFHIVVR